MEAVRAAALGTGAPGLELPARDLAPGCAQDPGRVLPIDLVDADLRAAEAAFPAAAVRAVLVYANNIDLTLPWGVVRSIEELRRRARERGAQPPIVWGVVLARAFSPVLDSSIAWTHATDEPMWQRIAQQLALDLPLQTRTELVRSAPLSSPSRALLLKVCASAGAQVEGCALSGRACPVTADGPRATATFPAAVAVPRRLFSTGSAWVSFEPCAGRCERYVELGGRLARWDDVTGCVTRGP